MSRIDRWLERSGLDRSDAKHLAYLPLLLMASWLLPIRAWPAVASFVTGLPQPLALFPPSRNSVAWPGRADAPTRSRKRVEQNLQYLRDLRPGGWRPPIRTVNAETLRAVQQDGHGVILWVADTMSARLVAKKALHREGFAVHQLSRPSHGGSLSETGIRYLNGIVRHVENRYLAERVMVRDGNEFAATNRLLDVLSRGGVVSITACGEGRQVRQLRIRGGLWTLATGAPALAHATGAALVPIFALEDRTGSSTFTVIVDRPLAVDRTASRAKAVHAAMEELVGRHAQALEGRWDQWRGFEELAPVEAADA